MQSSIAFNVISKQFTKHANSIQKLEFDINASAASTVYVQVHDFPTPADLAAGNTVPANGTVPLKSWPILAGATQNYKEFKNGEFAFKYGCFVCVSTTQATLTMGTGNNKFDSVAVELWDYDITGTTEVVSSGAVDNQAIYSEATGAASVLSLLRLACTNGEAGIRYAMLFCVDAPNDGDRPLMQWTMAANGDSGGKDTIYVDFGVKAQNSIKGFTPFTQTSAHVQKRGANLLISTTPGMLTQSVGIGMKVYGEYK